MAQDDPRITKEVEGIEKFEGLLREGWSKPWWREFIKLVDQQKTKYTNELILGMADGAALTVKGEDINRGKILALAWILAIDALGMQLHEKEKDEDYGRRD